jgi:hypothetical protein
MLLMLAVAVEELPVHLLQAALEVAAQVAAEMEQELQAPLI